MVELSVVIPSRNTEKTIEKTLKSVFANSYPRNKYEVIVVDSSDSDMSYLAKKFPIRLLRVKPTRNRIANSQRNIGAKAARGKIIFYTDSDCIVPKNWMRTIMKQFNGNEIAVVGGGVTTSGNIYDNYLQNSIRSGMRVFKKAEITDASNFHKRLWPLGANQAFRKSVLRKMNYFNEKISFYEEVDILWRIAESKFKILSIPNATVRHTYNKSFFGICKTYFRYGFGCGYFCMKYPNSPLSQRRVVLLVSTLAFYFLIILSLEKFSYLFPLAFIPLSFLAGYYALIKRIGMKTALFTLFDIIFAGISYIIGMTIATLIYPFQKNWK